VELSSLSVLPDIQADQLKSIFSLEAKHDRFQDKDFQVHPFVSAKGVDHLNTSITLPVAQILAEKHAVRPMDFADACLVQMAELEKRCRIWTIDRNDFRTYRCHERQTVQLDQVFKLY